MVCQRIDEKPCVNIIVYSNFGSQKKENLSTVWYEEGNLEAKV